MTDRIQLPFWKKALFSGILLLLVLGAMEAISSVYLRVARGYDGEHLLQYEFDPYKNLLPTRGFVDTRGIRHNAQGFRRSSDVPLEKPAGTYRVFLMGGSTAYGLGGLWPHLQREFAVLDNAETIDAYLERDLRAAFPDLKVEVINAAITSTWTHHHLIYLNQTILRYDPDMVVFVDGFNDFYFTDPRHDQFASYAYQEHSRVIMGEPTLKALVFANGWWLSRRSAFAHLAYRGAQGIRRALDRPGESPPLDVEAEMAGLGRVFPENALKMVQRNTRLLRDEGVRPVVVLQPMLILERERERMPETERKLFEFNVASYPANYEALSRRAVPFVSALTRERVEESGGTYVDATGIYREAEGQVFTDYAHLTPLGNELLARRILEAVAPLVAEDTGLPDLTRARFTAAPRGSPP